MKIFTAIIAALLIAGCTDSSGPKPPVDPPGPVEPTPTPVEPQPEPPKPVGFTNIVEKFMVQSDGTFSLGNPNDPVNATRDKGSKIVYFDVTTPDNTTGEAYWYHNGKIVDTKGSATNEQGLAYGTDPLNPNQAAIKPFKHLEEKHPKMRTVKQARNIGLSDTFPDWYLYRRGQTHTVFGEYYQGGKSEKVPMVIAAYGNVHEKRPVINPEKKNPFQFHNFGYPTSWMHIVVASLEMKKEVSYLNFHVADSTGGGPTTAYFEDVLFNDTIVYPVKKSIFHRCASAHASEAKNGHKQAYYTGQYKNDVTFSEMVFYKGGHKSDSRIDVDPKRDIYSRNIYQGGGAQLGHKYLNMMSLDGGSGGPQMRLGGIMDNSLVVEGYVYSGTHSNSPTNEWMEANGQVGSSAIVKNSVQLVFRYPNAADPDDLGKSDVRAQPGWGYGLQGASFGATVSGNIISGAMLMDDLKNNEANYGMTLHNNLETYSNGKVFAQQNNVIENNIFYRVKEGMNLRGDYAQSKGIIVRNNVLVSVNNGFKNEAANVTDKSQLHVHGNEIYSKASGFTDQSYANDNSLKPYADGVGKGKRFSDPDRTLKRYVLEVLKVELLEWEDDPFLDKTQVAAAKAKGNLYDPAGIKTFALMVTQMRQGGRDVLPVGKKPSFTGDYAWDDRLTAKAVNNWIRAGFDMPEVK